MIQKPTSRRLAHLILLLVALAVWPAWAEPPLRFAVLANRDKTQTSMEWQPLAQHLEGVLNRPVQLVVLDYRELETVVAENSIDVVLTNPSNFVLLQHRYGLSAPLVTKVSRQGQDKTAAFGGVIFARAEDRRIGSLADLVGKRIAVSDTNSFGGYQVPLFELVEHGLPEPAPNMLLLTGPSQDSTVAAVLDGQADVGFVRSGLIEAMARNNKLDRQRIKIINLQNLTGFPFASSTRLFPEWPVVVMPQVDDVTARKLTIALLSLPPDGPVVRAAGIDGFANPANYSSVENLQQRLRLPPFNIRPEVTLADLWRQYDRWIVAFGILAMLLIGAGISLWILYQQARKAQRALAEHGNQLERLVENRTRELETAKDAAETANRAKSTFLSNMSHELRTPMNAIMGMTGISLRKATDPQLIDRLTKVDQASQHLLAVINDILDISKIEAERMTLEHANFTLGEVTGNLVDLLDHKAQAKMTRLSVTLAPELATRPIVGDALRLGQILINFTGNAIKFTERGSITVRASVATETATDLLLRFEVQDTGIGISATDQLRLFTAFEQADGSTTRKYGGSGLGLAISKRLAQLMGGEVGVESAEGRGSTFWCTVRVGKAKPSLIAGAVPPAPTFSTVSAEHRLQADFAEVRLLLAEDEPVNREVSRGLLEDIGLQVDIAEDGVDAVAMAQATRYDLILMDMQMPRLNGVDATRQIRQLPGYAHTPILAMTANAFDEDRQTCLAAGMNDHIAKPVNPTLLFKTLLLWLERSRTAMH